MFTILEEYTNIYLISTIDTSYKCLCSSKHVPDPRVLMGLDAEEQAVLLCPTAASNVASLLTEFDKAGGSPLGSVTKHYGKYIRDLANTIWRNKMS